MDRHKKGVDMLIGKSYKTKRRKNILIGFVVVILVLNIINVQAFADENVVGEIKDILNNYYIDEVSQDVLSKDSANDIIKDLNDPYTQIMNKDDFNSIVNNTFFGIGVTIEMTEIGAVISSVMVNSPAMEAGLKEGDIIIVADNNYLKGLSASNALSILNGKAGVKSELKLLRKNEVIIINVKPETVYYPTVFSNIVDKQIAYIHIMSFGENTLDEFKYKVNSLNTESVNSFIIDLRNNPGGYIYSAVEIAGYFLNDGIKDNTVAIAQVKNGSKFKFKANDKSKAIDKPTVFLVNKYTASAAEVLAACVQDYKTAVVIGETTYGKGVAQSTFKLSDGSILKATTLKLYSPNGRDISNGGIAPDIFFNKVDSLLAGELLSVGTNKLSSNSKIANAVINKKNYYIDINRIANKDYWEAYRQIISQATSIDVSNYSQLNQGNKVVKNYPIIKYTEVPKAEYKVGDRVSFKVNSPNYNGQVQYRAMLWNENEGRYINLWDTKDFYYDKWKPRGKDVFTISFPVTKIGNYRIKVFAKRSGIANSKGVLKGMNSDSYLYEVPFKVNS